MFSRNTIALSFKAAATGLAILLAAGLGPALADDALYAVVPTQIIYAGDVISAAHLQEVEVTNPNLTGDYARKIVDVDGMISKRTLLPGRTISVSGLRVPYAVSRGSSVRLTFAIGSMIISASGTPLQDAAIGDLIKVRNIDSGITVSGTVMADGTVRVMGK
jgi:flagella basal body P-ring formation protein FlgA